MTMVKETYTKLSPVEHILKRPGMYVGTMNTELKKMFVSDNVDSVNIKFKNKLIHYNPGFFNIFNEILTNSADHYVRSEKVKYIKINVGKDNISVENDGPGIPIEIHSKEKIYNPELIFGNLHTSSNYDDSIARKYGGLHGLGGKLTNIFSKKFIVETGDGKNKYLQVFEKNMSVIGKPIIKPSKNNYTKITFYPDFEKFGLTEITPEIEQVIIKRIFDISMYCIKAKVYYNDKLIPINSFKDYMKMYIDEESETFYEKINDDWEIGVAQSSDDGGFQHISMVNGISTVVGGTHVNLIANQIVNGVKESLEKKYKKVTIKQNDIKM